MQHRLLQTDSTDAAHAAVGQTPLDTALAAVEQIRAFEAQACSCRPHTSGESTDYCTVRRPDTQTRPGKAQTAVEETSSRAAQAAIEETHVQRQHMLL